MALRLPDHITFTGVDDSTPIEGMRKLSQRYPIEWGVLLSEKRQGHDPRYPSQFKLDEIVGSGLTLAAHLCGAYSDLISFSGWPGPLPVDLALFKRVQVNHQDLNRSNLYRFAHSVEHDKGATVIAQTREDSFPQPWEVAWLFDRSGGRGEVPAAWPRHDDVDRLVGFAGGISPANVVDVLKAIDSGGAYWIDMESGVRTAKNIFSLPLCAQVCRQVYDGGF